MIPPLVTIITPSYNQGRFIEETIQSVLSQDYPNIEYIIVDGGSSDNTLDILRKYDGKLKWISEKDNGQSDAINKGFRMAKGEIVAWLNSDDTYEPGAITAAVNYFTHHPNCLLVYGEGSIIDEHSNKVKQFDATQEFDLWMLVNVWDYIMQPTTFFKKDALKKVNFLNIDLHWCMDWDLWVKLATIGEVGYINKLLANSREYAETKTSTGGWKRLKEIHTLMEYYSGKKYSYGLFLYGASTLYQECKGKFLLNLFGELVLRFTQTFIFSNLPVKTKDNWVGSRLELLIPSYQNTVEIRGAFIFSEIVPNKITVRQNQQFYKEYVMNELGDFNISVPLDNNKVSLHSISIRVHKYLIPNKIDANNNDKRKLGFLLREIK